MSELLNFLNESQREAVTSTEGFIRVIAGAGSGKTRALSHRFAYLVNELGILPGNILCVTFTNKSANEMRHRIHTLTGDNDTGYINTFHGFCVSILQEDSHVISYPKSFMVLDNSDIDDMLKIIYEERGLSLKDMTFSHARDMIEIEKLKNRPDYYKDMLSMSLDNLYQKYQEATSAKDIIFYGYLYQEKKCFGLDYNDLIVFSLYIFELNEEVCLKWQKRLEYIMIDEFQDIDPPQYRLMEVLCDYHKNLFIVGDPDQTIYTWRGANVAFLLDFDKKFPNVKTIMMMDNYRSTPEILNVANSLIENNTLRIKKELLPTLPSGKSVLCHHAKTASDEADWIVSEIKKLTEQNVDLNDITILYRAHYISRNLEEAFLKAKLPYNIYSGIQFFSRMEIKDALSYLKMIVYKDDLAFRRVCNTPKRNLGKRRLEFLEARAKEENCTLYEALERNIDDPIFKNTGAWKFIKLIEDFSSTYSDRSVSEVFADLLDKSGYEEALRTEGGQERLDNLAELKQSIFEFETSCGEECTLEHYLTHIALFTNQDADNMGNKVKFMTVHTAKGLEFPYVFLCGMNEGIFPSRKTDSLPGMEEERRLCFVALTRAREGLYISEAEGRNFDGSPRYPSRFILDISPELLEFTEKPDEKYIAAAREYISANSKILSDRKASAQFHLEDRVSHSVFGDGTIIEVDEKKQFYIIKFDSLPTPRSISFRVKLDLL